MIGTPVIAMRPAGIGATGAGASLLGNTCSRPAVSVVFAGGFPPLWANRSVGFATRSGSCSPAIAVPFRIVPRVNGPAPNTQVSLTWLLDSTVPDCQRARPVTRL